MRHRLKVMWRAFQTDFPDLNLKRHGGTISSLDKFDFIRYPDAILEHGMTMTAQWYGRASGVITYGPMRTLRQYAIVVSDIDDLVADVLKVYGWDPGALMGTNGIVTEKPGREPAAYRHDAWPNLALDRVAVTKPYAEIGRRLGVSKNTICGRAWDMGLPANRAAVGGRGVKMPQRLTTRCCGEGLNSGRCAAPFWQPVDITNRPCWRKGIYGKSGGSRARNSPGSGNGLKISGCELGGGGAVAAAGIWAAPTAECIQDSVKVGSMRFAAYSDEERHLP